MSWRRDSHELCGAEGGSGMSQGLTCTSQSGQGGTELIQGHGPLERVSRGVLAAV